MRAIRRKWTVEEVAAVRAGWGYMRAKQLAALIGNGLTKNAVIGKANRMKLPPSGFNPTSGGQMTADRYAANRRNAHKPPRKWKPYSPRRAKVMETHEPDSLKLITIVDLHEDACHWPVGDPSDLDTFRYCGLRKSPDAGPYCSYHHSRSLKAFEESFSRVFACSP